MIANHHNLLLALPGRGARLTADDRARWTAARRLQPTLDNDNRNEDHDDARRPTAAPAELTGDQLELRDRARDFVERAC